jgi:predicted ATPase
MWLHDKVQEAALSLAPTSESIRLKHQVGEAPFRHYSESELEGSIFVVANLFDDMCGPLSVLRHADGCCSISAAEIARLNLRAGEKSVEVSAFSSAARYARQGIQLLPLDRWGDEHFDLTLQLYYSIGAEAEGVLCNVDAMESYCK